MSWFFGVSGHWSWIGLEAKDFIKESDIWYNGDWMWEILVLCSCLLPEILKEILLSWRLYLESVFKLDCVYSFISVACPAVDDGEKQHKRFRLSSKSSPKESLHPTSLPLVEQDSSNYREKFIPPELSIWDYFIAKVTFFSTLK